MGLELSETGIKMGNFGKLVRHQIARSHGGQEESEFKMVLALN